MTQQPKSRAIDGACRKCGGFLIVERVLDYHSQTAGMKCINCGWYRSELQASPDPAEVVRSRGAYK